MVIFYTVKLYVGQNTGIYGSKFILSKFTYCPTKTNRGLEWYQANANDLLISRLVFLFKVKEPWPFKFK
jgi:hypothetical protein